MNKILIVDASDSDRRLMSGLLTRVGYEPHSQLFLFMGLTMTFTIVSFLRCGFRLSLRERRRTVCKSKTATIQELLFVNSYRLIVDCVDDFEFEVFGIVLVCHIAVYDALKQIFVDASGCYVIDDSLHTLHEVVGVPVVAVMNEKTYSDCQCHTLVGVLEVMTGA